MKLGRKSTGVLRHEARNRSRVARARDHLERVRQRDRSSLRTRKRDRDRARRQSSASPWAGRVRGVILFSGSLMLGALLAGPLQQWLSYLSDGGLDRVESISIQGNHHLSSEAVAAASGVGRGSALSEIDRDGVRERLEAHAWIRSAATLRSPPAGA